MVVLINKTYAKYCILSSLLGVANLVFCHNYYLIFILGMIEVVILLYKFATNNIVEYSLYYVMFAVVSLESAVGCYSVKDIEIGPINLYIILIIPIFVFFLGGGYKKEIHTCRYSFSFFKEIVIIAIISFSVGLIGVLLNYERYLMGGSVFILFLGEFEQRYFIFIAMFMMLLLSKNRENIKYIVGSIIAISFALFCQTIFAFMFGITGTYSVDDSVLLVADNAGFLILLLLFSECIEKGDIFKWIYIVFGSIASVMLLLYSPSGKNFISILLLMMVIIFRYMSSSSALKKISSVALVIVALVGVYIMLNTSGSSLFNYKLLQFERILDFGKGWFNNLPPSPRFRVAEFLNIGYEYITHPWELFTGKGVLGFFEDKLNLMSYYNGAFSAEEWSAGIFYNPHMAVNLILLESGIWGICMLVKLFMRTLKKYNPFLLIGLIWFAVYYGYSLSIAIFGGFCLVLGLLISDNVEIER